MGVWGCGWGPEMGTRDLRWGSSLWDGVQDPGMGSGDEIQGQESLGSGVWVRAGSGVRGWGPRGGVRGLRMGSRDGAQGCSPAIGDGVWGQERTGFEDGIGGRGPGWGLGTRQRRMGSGLGCGAQGCGARPAQLPAAERGRGPTYRRRPCAGGSRAAGAAGGCGDQRGCGAQGRGQRTEAEAGPETELGGGREAAAAPAGGAEAWAGPGRGLRTRGGA